MKSRLLAGTVLAGAVIAAAPASALVVTKTNTNSAVVSDAMITRGVSVGAGALTGSTGIITDVNITVDLSFCAGSGGTVTTGGCTGSSAGYPSNTKLELTGPSSTTVTLYPLLQFTGQDGGRFVITFDDAGAALPSSIASGTFAPTGSLSDFNGENALGTWSLAFTNNNDSDPAVFHDYELNITVADIVVVDDDNDVDIPEPATGAALLAGLGALWLRRKRRR